MDNDAKLKLPVFGCSFDWGILRIINVSRLARKPASWCDTHLHRSTLGLVFDILFWFFGVGEEGALFFAGKQPNFERMFGEAIISYLSGYRQCFMLTVGACFSEWLPGWSYQSSQVSWFTVIPCNSLHVFFRGEQRSVPFEEVERHLPFHP